MQNSRFLHGTRSAGQVIRGQLLLRQHLRLLRIRSEVRHWNRSHTHATQEYDRVSLSVLQSIHWRPPQLHGRLQPRAGLNLRHNSSFKCSSLKSGVSTVKLAADVIMNVLRDAKLRPNQRQVMVLDTLLSSNYTYKHVQTNFNDALPWLPQQWEAYPFI